MERVKLFRDKLLRGAFEERGINFLDSEKVRNLLVI